jgi:anti-sigma factor RsiW
MNRDHISSELLLRRLDAELPPEEQPALDAHLAGCTECASRFEKLRAISGVLDNYSASLIDSHALKQRRALLEAIGKQPATFPKTALAALAIAACVVVAVGISLVISKPPAHPGGPAQFASDGFIALPYSDESLSAEGAVVLQVEVPRSAVALAGIPVGDGPSNGRVKAEVMVGADGLARAIRFLN